ncbi:eukaryotic translation initiation factor 3 subunit M-like [Paramacrobiotus metropolitanus]|uniref:eukaryotic translation initiation factor 3 subunit M-like n=1 Tax=Paramacrobiotus metropolitanus TaxID=2943436 RepID=UPI0024462B77|nr:eukaryotic translation initiation factor 3 subunit M-like [Paramacrobiotus metropolitanus]
MHLKDTMKIKASVPLFMPKPLNEQLTDIAKYFKNELKADIVVPVADRDTDEGPPTASTSDLILTLFSLVENVSLTNRLAQENMVESLLNGILACVLFIEVPEETREKLATMLANKLADISGENGNKFAVVRLRVLSTLFYGLPESSDLRFTPYCRMLELASGCSLLHRVVTDPIKVKEWMKSWKLDDSRVRAVWRILHAALLKAEENTKASRVMVELLKTFTLETAGEAKEEAFQCVRDAIADPYAVSLDHLTHLKPVQGLRGQPIFDLLNVFVAGNVSEYMHFRTKNPDALQKIGLSHDDNLRKIRLLTFLNMSRGQQEIVYAEIAKQLHLDAGETEADKVRKVEEVENFIIEALKTRLISGKMDAAHQRFRVTTCMEPSFSKVKWVELRDGLSVWQQQVRHMKRMLASVTNPDGNLA